MKLTNNNKRCRWPDCSCYSPQGPRECRRLSVSPLASQWAYFEKVDAERRAALSGDRPKEDHDV